MKLYKAEAFKIFLLMLHLNSELVWKIPKVWEKKKQHTSPVCGKFINLICTITKKKKNTSNEFQNTDSEISWVSFFLLSKQIYHICKIFIHGEWLPVNPSFLQHSTVVKQSVKCQNMTSYFLIWSEKKTKHTL